MNTTVDVKTFLSLKEGKEIPNEIIFTVAHAGWGKTLLMEEIAEKFHKAGYVVFIISDVKRGKYEFGFGMFKPEKDYHLNQLRIQGTVPKEKKIKLYHPFTFSLAEEKKMLPEINFFTFSLKDMGEKEWGFLAETDKSTDTVKLLETATQNASNEDGIFSLLHYLQDEIKGKKEGRHFAPDWKNFGLSISMGTPKSLQDISNYFQVFKKDYFIAKASCPLNLNFKEMLNDQEHYHVFLNNWISKEKLWDFTTLVLFNKIMEYRKYGRYPVLVIIPEIRRQCPDKIEGHKIQLAQCIMGNLSIMRNTGKGGMSAIMDTQVFEDTNPRVVNSATKTFLGEIGAMGDLDRIGKVLQLSKEIKTQLKKMDSGKNSYYLVGHENEGAFKAYLPSAMHAEEGYDFEEMYRKYYSKKMKRYEKEITLMRKIYVDEENKLKEKVKRRQKERELEQEKLEVKKETKKSGKIDEMAEKIKNKSKEVLNLKKEQFFRDVREHPDKSERKLAKDNGISRPTVKRWIEEMKEKENHSDNHLDNHLDDSITEQSNGKVPEEMIGTGVMQEEIDKANGEESAEEIVVEEEQTDSE